MTDFKHSNFRKRSPKKLQITVNKLFLSVLLLGILFLFIGEFLCITWLKAVITNFGGTLVATAIGIILFSLTDAKKLLTEVTSNAIATGDYLNHLSSEILEDFEKNIIKTQSKTYNKFDERLYKKLKNIRNDVISNFQLFGRTISISLHKADTSIVRNFNINEYYIYEYYDCYKIKLNDIEGVNPYNLVIEHSTNVPSNHEFENIEDLVLSFNLRFGNDEALDLSSLIKSESKELTMKKYNSNDLVKEIKKIGFNFSKEYDLKNYLQNGQDEILVTVNHRTLRHIDDNLIALKIRFPTKELSFELNNYREKEDSFQYEGITYTHWENNEKPTIDHFDLNKHFKTNGIRANILGWLLPGEGMIIKVNKLKKGE